MNDRDSETVGPMLNPPHLGELIRESMEASHWNVTETAARLGCERGTLENDEVVASAQWAGWRVR